MRFFPLIALLFAANLAAAAEQLQGELKAHDPSTIVECNGEYWMFATGQGLRSLHSHDLVHWSEGPRVFDKAPDWTSRTVPGNTGYFWAPDVIKIGNEYRLYYSVSVFGLNTSAIGLATNPTLDPRDLGYHWTDRGIVIRSGNGDAFNAIDPAVVHAPDGKQWLAFGSYWSGIKLIELNRTTGLRASPNSPMYSLAHHDSIEAAYIYHHGVYFYLFVNWGMCCRGVRSTYEIRIGRSRKIEGPYLDQSGVDMMRDGGTPFLVTRGRFIGPGHAGIISATATEWLSYHFYDAENQGRGTLGISRLRWRGDGWPEAL